MNSAQSRITSIDALRGFALVSIVLIHNIEHFDYYYTPTGLPEWMPAIDQGIWNTLFFLFSGKSYAIFAFLFGVTFFLQFQNQALKGEDFRPRFAWRMCMLFLFALINGAFYQGDILMTYAVIAFGLIPFAKLSNRVVFFIALFFMAQPYEWYKLIQGIRYPIEKLEDPESWTYFGKMVSYIPENSFLNTVIGNLTNGRIAVAKWTWENGRVFQTLSLFMLGMIAGRKNLFTISPSSKSFWLKTLLVAAIAFVPLFMVSKEIETSTLAESIRRPLLIIESSWSNMAFMLVLVSGFVVLYQTLAIQKVLDVFSPIGKMSMTNYFLQSIVGSFIYYGYGLGWYQCTGSTYGLLIGLFMVVFQGVFSAWWMGSYKQGPLEALWHKATWINSGNRKLKTANRV